MSYQINWRVFASDGGLSAEEVSLLSNQQTQALLHEALLDCLVNLFPEFAGKFSIGIGSAEVAWLSHYPAILR